MPLLYSSVIDAETVVNEAGDPEAVQFWGKVTRALISRIEPRSRKSYEHEGYVFYPIFKWTTGRIPLKRDADFLFALSFTTS